MLHLYFLFVAEINSVLSKDFCFLGVMYLPLNGAPKQYLLVLDKRDRISKVKDLLHQMIETEKDIIMAEVLDHHVARIVVSC